MGKKSRNRKAQDRLRYKSALPVAQIVADLAARQALPAQNPQYLRYHALLLDAVPAEWHEQIRIGRLQYQGFEIFAVDSALAYRLRFLAPEIQRQMGKSLPHAPPVIVKVDPGLKDWYTRRRPKSLPAPRGRLSDAEARQVLDNFFAAQRRKTGGSG